MLGAPGAGCPRRSPPIPGPAGSAPRAGRAGRRNAGPGPQSRGALEQATRHACRRAGHSGGPAPPAARGARGPGEKRVEVGVRRFAAGHRARWPSRLAHRWEEGLQPLQRVLGELAVGRDLATEDDSSGAVAGRAVDVEDIVARHGRRVAGTVVEERPDARKAMDHVARAQRRLEIAVDDAEQVGDLAARRSPRPRARPS